MTQAEWRDELGATSVEELWQPAARARGARLRWFPLLGVAVLLVPVTVALSLGSLDLAMSLTMAIVATGVVAGRIGTRSFTSDSTESLTRHTDAGWAKLQAEFARGRRHGRSFAFIAVPHRLWLPADSRQSDPYAAGIRTAMSVQRHLRAEDQAWADDRCVYIVISDCSRPEAQRFVERMRATMPELFETADIRPAHFPEDGVTVASLVEAAHGAMQMANAAASGK